MFKCSGEAARLGRRWAASLALFLAPMIAPAVQAAPSFVAFESGHVRPLALSSDGTKLFAVNTPNNTLVIYNVTSVGIFKHAEVSVGLEPVAVAIRNSSEVWVVNHLSDSVSVVSLSGTPRVTRTLLVGDEPRDIVFAGTTGRAFITTAHRGQQRTDASIAAVPGAGDPQLTTPGVGRADVWVFDPANLGAAFGGSPLKILSFFSDTPRALAVSPDRKTVYAAAFKSGNQTTTVFELMVCDGFDPNTPCSFAGNTLPGGNPGPMTNFEGKRAPEVGLIVKFNTASGHWEDELGRNWDAAVRFQLPDQDVFSIDANALTQKASFSHVGTTLFNMATNPKTGKLYISNTEAINNVRFEGPGVVGGSTVQGRLAQTRITVISGTSVAPRHLNKHINYDVLANDPGFDPTVKNHSLSTPLEMVVSRDGRKLYIAAFGSSKVGVFDTAALEADTFNPVTSSANYISVSGGGPSGLALDESRNRLYVMTRFDNAVKVINLATKTEVAALPLFNPEPAQVVTGRPLLYDATDMSANGEAACASCHIFGDNDDLAWDLGNPDDLVTSNPIPIRLGFAALATQPRINGTGIVNEFHPMKGPMTTQTLRGMRNHGAMHWRGDRSHGFFGTDPFDPELSFNNFVVAFDGLIGRSTLPDLTTMQRFTNFQLEVQLPPNPVRNLDNSLTAAQQRGHDFYLGSRRADGAPPAAGPGTGFTCEGCHRLDASQGFFGTDGQASFEGLPQIVKIPHLRNAYTKVGMFGFPGMPFFTTPDTGNTGNQIRGFGYLHDGSIDTVFHFLSAVLFAPTPEVGFPAATYEGTRRDMEQFMLAFDSDIAPIVGQQITLTKTNAAAVGPRIDLLQARAAAPFTSKTLGGGVTECDLVAKVTLAGTPRGFLYNASSDSFVLSGSALDVPDALFRALALIPGQEITFTCVPPGSGTRIAAVP
ncbi:YncE family protein [Steroidobacter flavus]|uniref:YncE family protein n=1 Tax=Steroidobacter flavus TaxID=1842136 RepID=A0ABV8T038_9GAMM